MSSPQSGPGSPTRPSAPRKAALPWERPAAIRRGLVRDANSHGATQQQATRVADGAAASGSLASTADSPSQDETQRRLLKAKGPLYRRLSGQALKTSFLLSTQQVATPDVPYAATGSPTFYTAERLAARFVGTAVVLYHNRQTAHSVLPHGRCRPGSPSPTLRGWLQRSTPYGLSAEFLSPPRWCVCCGSTSTDARPLLLPLPPPLSPPLRRACTGLRGAARALTRNCCLSSPRPRSCSRRCLRRFPRQYQSSRAAPRSCLRRCRAALARWCLLLLTSRGPRRHLRGPLACLLQLQTPRDPWGRLLAAQQRLRQPSSAQTSRVRAAARGIPVLQIGQQAVGRGKVGRGMPVVRRGQQAVGRVQLRQEEAVGGLTNGRRASRRCGRRVS